MLSSGAYQKSYQVLVERYGDQFTMAGSFRQRLKTWPRVGSTDGAGLREFVDFLRQCETAMTSIPALLILNDEYENVEIIKKLPGWLSRKWIARIAMFRREENRFPSFSMFVNFLADEELIANDPVALMLQGDSTKDNRRVSGRGASFAVGAVNMPHKEGNFEVCVFCGQNHSIHICESFKAERFEERLNFVKNNRLCFGCLARGHILRNCKHPIVCTVCRGPHPLAMHKEPEATTNSATTYVGHNSASGSLRKSSMIVPVFVSHVSNPDKETLTYAMIDTQSDTSFISESTADDLGVKGKETKLLLSTMTSSNKMVNCKRFSDLRVRGVRSNEFLTLPVLFSRESIPANRSHIPRTSMTEGWPHLKSIAEHLVPVQDCEIGLLLGYDCPKALATRNIIRAPGTEEGPFGMETALGWGIVGIISYGPDFPTDNIGFSHRILAAPATGSQIVVPLRAKEISSPQECLRILESDFRDEGHDQEGSSLNDRRFLNIMEEGVKIDEVGNYSLPLPFNVRKGELFDNRKLVLQRTMSLKRKLERDPDYCAEYKEFMRDMIEKGFAEEVEAPAATQREEVWYIPHFGVYHKVKKKLRVVFDCAARYNGIALNDALYKGPDLTNSLIGILCRFREQPIAFACDIEKMFYSFHVPESDRDFLRFLWWKDGNTRNNLSTYRMTAHIFGAVSSPACATYGLRYAAKDLAGRYGTAAGEFINRNFYVDDGLQSVQGIEEAKDLVKQTVSLCRERRIRLHKFISNSTEVLRSLPQSECAMESSTLEFERAEATTERILGVLWDVKQDAFLFKTQTDKHPTTRRAILSVTSGVFDPLGWISPFILRARAMLQQLCIDHLDWDDVVPSDLLNKWNDWYRDIFGLQSLRIDRNFHFRDYRHDQVVQLHHFADASSLGYGACSYIRLVDDSDRVSVHLVMAKARVAPISSTTIPRLELTAAVIAARLSVILDRELSLKNIEHFFWTDSRIVLGYLSNESRRFKVYVANRIQEIHNVSEPSQWRHINSCDNPADIASRGISAGNLVKSSLWFHGPAFLHNKTLRLTDSVIMPIPEDDQELKRVVTCFASIAHEGLDPSLFDSFSCWRALRRGVARAKQLARKVKIQFSRGVTTRSKLRKNKERGLPDLSVEDLVDAERVIIAAIQNSYFSEEIGLLRSKEEIPTTSNLIKLDCFLDDAGLLRVGGRLKFAQLYSEQKHPVVIPKGTHIATLIIRDCHQSIKHQGRGMTLNEIRSRGYWVVGLNQQVKRLINSCVPCRILRGSVQSQKMADLPQDRIQPAPPFTYCGVDFFGPFLVKERRSEVKRYGCLFTCLVSRAVHIEMAYSLTTDAFIQCLRKFLAIRGPIRHLRCDNGTNFVGASKELSKAIDKIQVNSLKSFLLNNNCDLEFKWNPPSASHMGGVWERLIRTTRSILSSLIDQHGDRLDDNSLSTFLYEAAAIINCRPLSLEAITDAQSPEPLTPNHLLTGKSRVILPPPGQFCREDVYSTKRWRCVQHLADRFWQRWRDEYLCYLQARGKWQQKQRNMTVGDVVLVKGEDAFRNNWRRGRIVEVVASKDGHVRQVKLKMGIHSHAGAIDDQETGGTLVRPIHKLVLLLPSELKEES